MAFATFDDVLTHELQDLHHAEMQLVAALPKMAAAAQRPELKKAFEEHLVETEEQAARVASILTRRNQPVQGEPCPAMMGLLREAGSLVEEHEAGVLRDVALIGSAQRIEHYEIAAYGTARTLAQHLGDAEASALLETTLQEERSADDKLTNLAQGDWVHAGINEMAAQASS